MIVTSGKEEHKWALYKFLREHGVEICRSEDFQAIGRVSLNTKDLVGVVGYNGFTGRTCCMHVAGIGNWITRSFIWAAFDYPFNQVDCVQVFATVAERNRRALRMNSRLGFNTIGTIPNGWAVGEGMVMLTMSKKDCRWLEKNHELKVA